MNHFSRIAILCALASKFALTPAIGQKRSAGPYLNKKINENTTTCNHVNIAQYLHTSFITKTTLFLPDLPKTEVDLDNTKDQIEINNNTQYQLNDLLIWACDYLKVENIWINISYLHPMSRLAGLVEQAGFDMHGKNSYNMYLKRDIDKGKLNLIVLHELVHIKQFEYDQLKLVDNTNVFYKGEKINLKKIRYKFRAHEKEAHLLDYELLKVYRSHLKLAKNEHGY